MSPVPLKSQSRSSPSSATRCAVQLACAVVLMSSALRGVSATFYPYPNVDHADHNDDHLGYFVTLRVNTLLPGATVAQGVQALTAYLYQVTARDDLIEYGAFFDNATDSFVTTGLWRTQAGAEASFDAAIAAANYKLWMTQSFYYGGTVRNFFELEEVHSAVELGLYRQMRVSTLVNPRAWNSTNIPAIVQQNVFPVAQQLPGIIDYTTTYPVVPFANTFWMTEKTYSNASIFSRDSSALEPTIQQYLGDKLGDDIFYEGQITVFWHSAPGRTDPLPQGVSAPVVPSTAPGVTPCLSGAPGTAVASLLTAAAAAVLAFAAARS